MNANNTLVNTLNAIAQRLGGTSRNHNALNIIDNNKTNNNTIQENTTMNPNTIIARFTTGLVALASLVALTPPAANAQATILSVTPPYYATGLTSRQTVVQFQVFNTGTASRSDVQIQAVLMTKGSPAGGLILTSSAFSLTGHQQKTISITVPKTASDGVALLNRELTGLALVFDGNTVDEITSVDFVDKLPTADLQITNCVTTSNGGIPVLTVTVTNNGTWVSDATETSANTLSAELWQYDDGKTPPDVMLSQAVESLGVGASHKYTFSFSALAGMQYQGQLWVDQSEWSIN